VTGESVTGGCLCGAVRYRATLPALWVAHCHCSICRRAHGAGFVTWAGFPREAVAVEQGAAELRRYHSSVAATRSFCGRCGSQVFFQSEHWPSETHVTLASMDSAAGLVPQAHAYWSSRAPWADWGGEELAKPDSLDHAS
jgi:hypothetical protein